MNHHDQRRKDKLVKTLLKAKEQAETANLYLEANEQNLDDVMNMILALENIEVALEHLGAARKCRVCGCTEHNACDGGCCWVGEDLCSSCVASIEDHLNNGTSTEMVR